MIEKTYHRVKTTVVGPLPALDGQVVNGEEDKSTDKVIIDAHDTLRVVVTATVITGGKTMPFRRFFSD